MKTVVVGMSGGVDSSVSALLLKQAGYRVIALFMKNWEEKGEDGRCSAEADQADVARVCDLLEIPFYTVNFTQAYWDEVFSEFLAGIQAGYTPNPDVLCNQKIKFHHFYHKAKELGADFLATGHYCQITPEGYLARGADPQKDQTYFTYGIDPSLFPSLLFPIGHLPKSQVRALAQEAQLHTAQKKDSTGICFVGKRPFQPFIAQYLKAEKGEIIDTEGKKLGIHEGAIYYTIGQRKGLGIGGPGEAWFVVEKDLQRNKVIVAQGENHPALLSKSLRFVKPHWIHEKRRECTAKIRYRATDVACLIEEDEVVFKEPVRAATPGQSIVFYDKEICLGGAIIDTVQRLDPSLRPLGGISQATLPAG